MTPIVPIHYPDSGRRRLSRKMLLAAPLLLFPLLTLLIWSCGLLALPAAGAAPAARIGLNSSLPTAVIAADSDWTKLSYYKKADRDSARRREEIKRDPYYGLRATDASLAPEEGAAEHEASLVRAAAATLARSPGPAYSAGSAYPPAHTRGARKADTATPANPDSLTRELYRKLTTLQQALDQAPATVSPATAAAPSAIVRHTDPDYASLQDQHAATPDPEMAQISALMDKILAVQHPDLVTDSLRRAAAKDAATPYAVHGAEDGGGLGTVPGGRRAAADSLAVAVTRPPTAFYSLETSSWDDDQPPAATLKAVVPETQTLSAGSRVTIALSEDMFVRGVRIPQGTLLYGEARIGADRMMIRVSSLVSGGQIIPVALSVYDLDGLEGIHVPQAGTRQSLKASGATAVESVGGVSVDPTISGRVADAGIQAAKNLLGRKIRKVTVTVRAGYRLLLEDQSGG